jgi:glycosyltransferase involved in cell wall biosynthesis
MELQVVGRIQPSHQAKVAARSLVPILWAGAVARARIPEIDRSAHLFFSADLNPACPNAVIEALACGLPVAAFDTGAMKEVVGGEAGRIVPYGADPWRLEEPDIPALAEASAGILRDRPRFSRAARLHAEQALSLDKMMDGYLRILLEA